MELYIVRHGETKWNSKHLLQGRADIELNENGRELAGITGKNLETVSFDRIYSSPLIRAYETACLIRGHRNIPIFRDDRLKEISFGDYEGRDSTELLDNKEDPFHYFFNEPEKFLPAPHGEHLEEVMLRAKYFLQDEIEPLENKLERVMIVAHGALNKGLMCHILNHDKKDYWSGGLQKNCGIIIVEYCNHTYTLKNDHAIFY